MRGSNHLSRRCFQRAVAGDPSALGALLQRFRLRLLKEAHASIAPDLREKVAPSDLVQSTLLCACKGFATASFTGLDDVWAWLRGIMELELKSLNRFYRGAAKRAIRRERPWNRQRSGDGVEALAIHPSSVRGSGRLERAEQIELLLAAMERLPGHYREIIRWRHFERMTFVAIGRMISEDENAVRMLFNRAIVRLKKELRRTPPPITPSSIRVPHHQVLPHVDQELDWEFRP